MPIDYGDGYYYEPTGREGNDEDYPHFEDEVFESMRGRVKPEDLPDPKDRREYEEWLAKYPEPNSWDTD